MAKRIKYPVGIHTFETIIKGGFIYVDKTALLYDLVETSQYVFLSRPRRFGKSLLTSTLEAYFKGEKDLFKGLAIEKLEEKWIQYPVFRFDLSAANYDHPQKLINSIENQLQILARKYDLPIEGTENSVRFINLIVRVHEKYGRKVVILIDEYDKPLLDKLHDKDLYEKLKAELRSFYAVIKASDEYIRFAMLTGITRFGKMSIFSGINNLRDISLLPKYNGICGITETEFHDNFKESIRGFADQYSLPIEETWERFKQAYDGYRFADTREYIYNPYSVINALNDGLIGSYWYKSGSPSFLPNLIERNTYVLTDLEGSVRSEIALSDVTEFDHDIVPLLYQSGYLTIKGVLPGLEFDDIFKEYILGIPNKEVYKAFWESLARRFFRGYGGSSAFDLKKFVRDVNEGRPEDFMLSLKSLFADTNSETEKDKEIHFQNMMAIACKMIGLAVRTEIHSARGRCDMQIQTSQFVYVFEFKIDGTPEEAMAQIIEKGYAEPFEADQRKLFLIGANFSTETRTLTGWIIK